MGAVSRATETKLNEPAKLPETERRGKCCGNGIQTNRRRAKRLDYCGPSDPVASAAPPAWAVRELQAALARQGVTANVFPKVGAAPAGGQTIVVAGGGNAAASEILRGANLSMPSSAEALCLAPGPPEWQVRSTRRRK
jgi:hypothetical protein